MIAVALSFTAGRYHATPWGKHVNEGVAEWPPSPWRILRALVAVRYRTLPADTVAGDTSATLGSLVAKLARPPRFVLPTATLGHSRHYVPWEKKGPGDRTLAFDTFVAIDRDQPVVVIWPDADLTETEAGLLRLLLDRLPYLGRAESWCAASICPVPPDANCTPIGESAADSNQEIVRVLVPDTSEPGELLDALSVDVGIVRTRERRLIPRGSRFERYARSRDCFALAPDATIDRHPVVTERYTVARYAIDAHPRPLLTSTVDVADLARQACLSIYGRLNARAVSPVLSGKSPDRVPLKDHAHAHYLPTDEDGDGYLDHLTIFARQGFDERERQALARLFELAPGGERPPLPLLLLGMGTEDDFNRVSMIRASRVWRTVTPFVLTRHPKVTRAGIPKLNEHGRQIDGPEDQVYREWEYRRRADPSLPRLERVEPVPVAVVGGRQIRWLAFRRWRTGEREGSSSAGYGFRLWFDAPVSGPIALGANCHFGLGQFVADDEPLVNSDPFHPSQPETIALSSQ